MATGLNRLLSARRRRRVGPGLFILEYHDVTGDGPEREGVISVDRFRRHLRYLKRRFRIDTVAGGAARLAERGALQEDRVVVTFDDGLAGNYRWAWPVLREAGVPATVFLTTGFLDGSELWFDFARRALVALGREPAETSPGVRRALKRGFGRESPSGDLESDIDRLRHMAPQTRDDVLRALRDAALDLAPSAEPLTWDQVREMQAGGVEMGAHTVSHPALSTLPEALQKSEIAESQERIAQETDTMPTSFAMPSGAFDGATVDILRSRGFRAACTTIRGFNPPGSDPMLHPRIGVGSDSIPVLETRLAGLFDEGVRRWLRRGPPSRGA
jgi:peptidoglycan/xylan/chitin deacetylase (PgdA/CDA1 family)